MAAGEYYILEHPKPGVLYGCGIDPIPTDPNDKGVTTDTDDRSNHVALILKFEPEPMPVAYYKIRAGDPWLIYNETEALQKYYNNAKAMVERNRGNVLLTRYGDAGQINSLLAAWPYAALVPAWDKIKPDANFKKRISEKGWFNAANYTKPAFDCVAEFLTYNTHNIWFDELLSEIEEYHIRNCDIFDAFMSAVLYYIHWKRTSMKKYEKHETTNLSYYATDSSGRMILKTTKVGGGRGHEGFPGVRR